MSYHVWHWQRAQGHKCTTPLSGASTVAYAIAAFLVSSSFFVSLTDIPSRTSPTLVSSILATELSICAYPTSVNPGTEFARPYRTQSTGTATGLTNAASSLLHDTFTSMLECENMRPLIFPRRRYTRKLETPMQSSRSISSMQRAHVIAGSSTSSQASYVRIISLDCAARRNSFRDWQLDVSVELHKPPLKL